jgi:chorismate dehydratase
MGRLRISAISYLNTAPLMWDFEHGKHVPEFEISYTIPSLCAEALRTGDADIGIIPAAAYTTIPDLYILPDVAIAAKREVRSILLVSKVPLQKIESVALDTSSMTSVALLKVLLSMLSKRECAFESMAPHLEPMLRANDAALLIGDPALRVERSGYFTYDLAEEWIRITGQPFVFAFWAIRKAALRNWSSESDLAHIFQQSRDHGLEKSSLDQLQREWSAKLGMAEEQVRRYLTENIYYYFDHPCMDGLTLFYEKAADLNVLPPAPALDFLDPARIATK